MCVWVRACVRVCVPYHCIEKMIIELLTNSVVLNDCSFRNVEKDDC